MTLALALLVEKCTCFYQLLYFFSSLEVKDYI